MCVCACVCVFVCVCVCVCVRACVHACVCDRERQKEKAQVKYGQIQILKKWTVHGVVSRAVTIM